MNATRFGILFMGAALAAAPAAAGKRLAEIEPRAAQPASSGDADWDWVLEVQVPRLPSDPSDGDDAPAAEGLRDAVGARRAEGGAGLCALPRTEIAKLQSRHLELKARFWAAVLADGTVPLRSLRKNLGEEIADRALRLRFFSLLEALQAARAPVRLSPAEVEEMVALRAALDCA